MKTTQGFNLTQVSDPNVGIRKARSEKKKSGTTRGGEEGEPSRKRREKKIWIDITVCPEKLGSGENNAIEAGEASEEKILRNKKKSEIGNPPTLCL